MVDYYYFSLNLSVQAKTEAEAHLMAKAEAQHLLDSISENDLPHELPFELWCAVEHQS